jgi:hypothetical protein
MRFDILYLTALLATADATYIKKWNLQGCPDGGYSMRCNNLPAGHCCDMGRFVGGSVKIDNLPSFVDISVPYSGRSGGGSNGATRCASPKLSQVRFGNLNCYSNPRIGTGLWLHCSRSLGAQQCISQSSVPHKRNSEGVSSAEASETSHLGYSDEEEANLPPVSFHGLNGEQVSEEEYERMSALEIAHEANGTLHLLYPDFYPPNYTDYYWLYTDNSTFAEDHEDEAFTTDTSTTTAISPNDAHRRAAVGVDKEPRDLQKRTSVDVVSYVNKQCRGELLARDTRKDGKCFTTINGASIYVQSLPKNCEVDVYTNGKCKGKPDLDAAKGASEGCYDADNFTSFKVRCS